MLTSYEEALVLQASDQESPTVNFKRWLTDTEAQVELVTDWEENPRLFSVTLRVPLIEEVRFDWDDGLYGHFVQFDRGAPRFCPPLLHSDHAQKIALADPRDRHDLFVSARSWGFEWLSWYDRAQRALGEGVNTLIRSQRALRAPLVRSTLQRTLTQLVNGAAGQSGLALTDRVPEDLLAPGSLLPVKEEWVHLLRDIYEVEVGYPDIANDNLLWEKVKLKFLEYLDSHPKYPCDIQHTGKSDVGRRVMRVPLDGNKSHVTGRPISPFAEKLNPLIGWANPIRVQRENRGVVDCLPFVEPTPPPLRLKGVVPDEGILRRMATLTILIANIEEWNLHTADEATAEEFGMQVTELQDGKLIRRRTIEPGDTTCLDGFLVTPSGRKKLVAYQTRSELMSHEVFSERLTDLEKRDGFAYEAHPELLEVDLQGQEVYLRRYRYWYEQPHRVGRDKLKLACGGLKGVTRPCPQRYAQIGEEVVEVDLIVAEDSLLSKGGKDLGLYILAANAGMEEIDPQWTKAQLGERIAAGLAQKGLDPTGRVQVYRKKRRVLKPEGMGSLLPDDAYVQLMETFEPGSLRWEETDELEPAGFGIAGPAPVFRANETEHRQSSSFASVAVNTQLRATVGREFPYIEQDQLLLVAGTSFVYRHGGLLSKEQR